MLSPLGWACLLKTAPQKAQLGTDLCRRPHKLPRPLVVGTVPRYLAKLEEINSRSTLYSSESTTEWLLCYGIAQKNWCAVLKCTSLQDRVEAVSLGTRKWVLQEALQVWGT